MTDELPVPSDDLDEVTGGASPAFEPPPTAESDEPDPDPTDEPEPTGNDNIREGRVGGLMGAPHATQGQGQGG